MTAKNLSPSDLAKICDDIEKRLLEPLRKMLREELVNELRGEVHREAMRIVQQGNESEIRRAIQELVRDNIELEIRIK